MSDTVPGLAADGCSPTRRIQSDLRRRALGFIVLLGTVGLLADMICDWARSINGPFLALLGASGLVVSLVAGFGIRRGARAAEAPDGGGP